MRVGLPRPRPGAGGARNEKAREKIKLNPDDGHRPPLQHSQPLPLPVNLLVDLVPVTATMPSKQSGRQGNTWRPGCLTFHQQQLTLPK